MGRTTATATIIGATGEREYEFLVDTGSTHIGLPQREIDELELSPVPNGVLQVLTATGIVERQSYWAIGEIDGRGIRNDDNRSADTADWLSSSGKPAIPSESGNPHAGGAYR